MEKFINFIEKYGWWLFPIIGIILNLVFWGTVIYVAIHFIGKYW